MKPVRALAAASAVFAALLSAVPAGATTPAGTAGTPSPAHVSGPASASGAHCRDYWFPVTTGPESKTVHREFGRLCTSDPAKLGKQPVQVLIHGGTYDHTYFDWPYRPERYNYVRYMTQRGFTTLSLDRLGYGHSDHPPSLALNFDTAAHTTHQIVRYLRGGALGPKFSTVVANGYSMGGLTAQVEAARYHDLDAVAVHAVGHGLLTPRSLLRLGTFVYPALLDPKFAGKPWALDPGYVTNLPGKRTLFHGPKGTYDPVQLRYEERLKDTMSVTELTDITLKSYTDLTKRIDVPVLWEPGRYDKIWCGTTDDCTTDPENAGEDRFYRPGVLTKYVVPNTGHGALLGYGGTDYLAGIVDWLAAKGIHGVR
ncbi:alpha/beta hydrolase [Sciscionella sediminilitoris]|uniref:alpha/beta hydrolase n=1 Tax=Sciscionella sediminilitoris TaxID=1445613 RepID=UPI00055EEA1F|nr:alpha/beta hydrolase [Sciscionella sp. SE31]